MNTNTKQSDRTKSRRFLLTMAAALMAMAAGSVKLTLAAPAAPPTGKQRPASRPTTPGGKKPAQKVILPTATPETAVEQTDVAPANPSADPAAPGQPGGALDPSAAPQPGIPQVDPSAVPGTPAGVPGQTPYPQPGVDIPVGTQVSPDVQRQIDQMMQAQAPPAGAEGPGKASAPMTPQQRAEERRKRAQEARERGAQGQNPNVVPPGGTPGGMPNMGGVPGMAGGESGKIDIPAGDQSIPAEQRTYKFSIKDASYQALLDGIAHETGLAVQGDYPPDGVVSFITDQEVTFDDMLARVRMLLFQYKPLEPYWLSRERTHLLVVKVNDYIRRFPPDRVYPTVREFRAAKLSADELVLVLFEPECGGIAAYAPVRDWLPDYVRVTPIDQKNAMAIYALAGDVEKFLWWGGQIVACNDPRKLEIIEIKFITPTEAAEKLQILMQLDPAKMAGAGRAVAQRGMPGQIGQGLEAVPAPEVSIVPEDAQGVLIVRAMPDKIEEMRKLLPFVDVNTAPHYLPVVVEVKFADPESLIATVQQVLASSVGETAVPGGMQQPGVPKAPRRSTRKTPANPAAPTPAANVSSADVSMIPHPTISAIIVMGSDQAVTKVRDLIAQLDVETQVGPERIVLQYIDADTAVQTITPILGGTVPGQASALSGVPRKASVPPQLIADPGGTSMWFTGTSKDLTRVKALVKEIDVAGDAVNLHIVKLVHKKPSFVATILAQVSDTGAGSAVPGGAAPAPAPKPRGGARRRGNAPTPPGGAQPTAATVTGAKITSDDDQGRLYIFCTDAEWEQYKLIIAELEGEMSVPEYTLITVQHITPDDALAKLSALVPDICGAGPGPAPGGNPAAGPAVRCETTEDGLLVLGANETQIKTIRRLLPEFDRPLNIEQRTFEIKHADASEVKQALEALINGNTPNSPIPSVSRRNRGGAQPAPNPAGVAASAGTATPGGMTIVQVDRRLIVSASPPILQRVADYITQFDVKADRRQIKVYQDFRPGTDIDAIAHNLSTIIGGTTTAATGPRVPRQVPGAQPPTPTGPEPGPQFIPLATANKLIVIAEETLFPEIEEMLKVLRETADPETIVRKYLPVKYADPNEIVEKIEPLLDMMVKRLIAQGEVVETTDETGAVQIKQRAGIPVGGALARNKPYHMAADGRNKRIVIAATQKIVDVATELVADFDTNQDKEEPIVALIDVKHVDPVELVDQIDPLLAIKVQRIGGEADFVEQTEVPPGQPGMPRGTPGLPGQRGLNQSKAQRYYIAPDERRKRIVVAAVQKIVDEARKLVAEFDVPGGEKGIEVESVPVKFIDPVILVELIDPLLTMKVEQYLSEGGLAPEGAANPGGSPQQAQAVRNQLQRQLNRNVGGRRFHMEPDQRNKQIVIAAPRLVIDEAKKLVTMFDVESAPDKPVFETLTLNNADPAEMVKAVKELMGSPVRAVPARAKAAAGGAGQQAAPTIEETIAGMFNIVVAPSGRAVVLSGPAKDVERAKGWVAQLDTISSGKTIKIYELKFADPEVVVDLIMNTVDTPDKLAVGRQPMVPPAKSKSGKGEEDEEEDDWEIPTTITRFGTDLYVRADLINNTLVVATTPAKMAEIDRLVAQFEDEKVAESVGPPPDVPKILIDVEHLDEFDAKSAFNTYVNAMWGKKDRPRAILGPGRNIIIECPDESRFDEIRDIVAKYVDKPKKEIIKRKVIQAPSGMSASQVAAWIEMAYPAVEFQVHGDKVTKQPDYGIEVVKAPQEPTASVNPCVLPLSLQRSANLIGALSLRQNPNEEPPAEEPAPDDGQVDELMRETVQQAILNEQMMQQQAAHAQRMAEIQQANQGAAKQPSDSAKPTPKTKDEGKGDAKDAAPEEDEADYTGKKVNIVYDDATGRLILEGPESIIKDVPDWIKDLKDELSKGVTPPDIRIVRVKYIDVYTAQDILEEMFNATRSQLQNLQFSQQQQQMRMQQQMQQQQIRAQQQQQRQAQQPQGKGGNQKEADQQQQVAGFDTPEVPQTSVRIYPNPRDRTLILRADTIQYPAIFEMLATIDQPRPVDSKHRIIQLKKLNAVDTEALLKDWLGLEEAKGRTQAQRGGVQQIPGNMGGMGGVPGRGGPGSQLPETIVSPTNERTGVLGVDPQDIKLSSNPENNTLLVMAPEAALDYIEKLIIDLEAQDIAARQWKSYSLVHADPEEIAEYLIARFNEKRAATRDRGKPGPDAPAATTASALQTATFVSYPRLKMLSVQATDEQLVEIDTLIKDMDVEAKENEYRTIALTHADAADVAGTLTDMFGTGGSSRAPSASRRDSESRTESVTPGGIRFIGEDGGRVVFYTAPKHLDERIAGVVKELEDESAVNTLRTIQLQFAKASTVADAIEQAMSGVRRSSRGSTRGASPPGGGGASGGGGSTPGTFSITASDSTKRLFVVADESTFSRIESLAKALDLEPKIDIEFKVFPLLHADAESVYDTLSALMTEYVKRLPPQSSIEAFSVEPNQATNSLIVLGGPIIFGFVEDALRRIDTPAAAPKQDIRTIQLLFSDAEEVQAAVQAYLRKPGSSAPATSGRGGSGQSVELIGDTRVSVLTQTNSIVISGNKDKLDQLETVIRDLDKAGEKGSVPRIIALKFANVGQLLPMLQEMFTGKTGGSKKGAPPVIGANETLNALVVRGSPTDVASIEAVVASMDNEQAKAAEPVKIIQIQPGVNLEELASIVENSVNESQIVMGGANKNVPRIVVTAEPRSNILVIAGSPMLFSQAEAMARKIEQMGPAGGVTTTVLKTPNMPVDEIQRLIDQLTNPSTSSDRSRRPSGGSGGGSRPSRNSGGSNRPRESTPAPAPTPRR